MLLESLSHPRDDCVLSLFESLSLYVLHDCFLLWFQSKSLSIVVRHVRFVCCRSIKVIILSPHLPHLFCDSTPFRGSRRFSHCYSWKWIIVGDVRSAECHIIPDFWPSEFYVQWWGLTRRVHRRPERNLIFGLRQVKEDVICQLKRA